MNLYQGILISKPYSLTISLVPAKKSAFKIEAISYTWVMDGLVFVAWASEDFTLLNYLPIFTNGVLVYKKPRFLLSLKNGKSWQYLALCVMVTRVQLFPWAGHQLSVQHIPAQIDVTHWCLVGIWAGEPSSEQLLMRPPLCSLYSPAFHTRALVAGFD